MRDKCTHPVFFSADGYAKDYGNGHVAATQAAGVGFVPVYLTLPTDVDADTTQVTIDYDASDPNGVQLTGSGTDEDPYVYTPASGTLRLWTRDASHERSAEAFDTQEYSADVGYYVPAGTYTLSTLFDRCNNGVARAIVLYVEVVATGETQTVSDVGTLASEPPNAINAAANAAPVHTTPIPITVTTQPAQGQAVTRRAQLSPLVDVMLVSHATVRSAEESIESLNRQIDKTEPEYGRLAEVGANGLATKYPGLFTGTFDHTGAYWLRNGNRGLMGSLLYIDWDIHIPPGGHWFDFTVTPTETLKTIITYPNGNTQPVPIPAGPVAEGQHREVRVRDPVGDRTWRAIYIDGPATPYEANANYTQTYTIDQTTVLRNKGIVVAKIRWELVLSVGPNDTNHHAALTVLQEKVYNFNGIEP